MPYALEFMTTQGEKLDRLNFNIAEANILVAGLIHVTDEKEWTCRIFHTMEELRLMGPPGALIRLHGEDLRVFFALVATVNEHYVKLTVNTCHRITDWNRRRDIVDNDPMPVPIKSSLNEFKTVENLSALVSFLAGAIAKGFSVSVIAKGVTA